MRVVGVPVINRDRVEPAAQIPVGLAHQVTSPGLQLRERRCVLRADDEAEMVPVIGAALREASAVRVVGLRVEEPRLRTVTRHALALEVADVGGEGGGAEARALVAHDACLDHKAARWRAARGLCRSGAAPPEVMSHRVVQRRRLAAGWAAGSGWHVGQPGGAGVAHRAEAVERHVARPLRRPGGGARGRPGGRSRAAASACPARRSRRASASRAPGGRCAAQAGSGCARSGRRRSGRPPPAPSAARRRSGEADHLPQQGRIAASRQQLAKGSPVGGHRGRSKAWG